MNSQLRFARILTYRGPWELAGFPRRIEELRTRLSEPEAKAHR